MRLGHYISLSIISIGFLFFSSCQERSSDDYKIQKDKGVKFLSENKLKDSVKTTESGLQYKVLKQGDGEKPAGGESQVTVHYHGTTIDGSVFDSSVERGKPLKFNLNQVISGWTEGLQLMNVGSKYRFFIPSDLAYGNRGVGELIKPGATLIFDVELLSTD